MFKKAVMPMNCGHFDYMPKDLGYSVRCTRNHRFSHHKLMTFFVEPVCARYFMIHKTLDRKYLMCPLSPFLSLLEFAYDSPETITVRYVGLLLLLGCCWT